ncbi:MAG: hypothetical protein ACRD1K_19335 [Acidimicrobiales bacterium]
MPSPGRTFSACLAAAAVLLGACSDGGGGAPEATAQPTAAASLAAVGAVQSSVSILRANLTALLQEHVFLTGATTATLIAGQDPAPAAAVLDANSVALSNVIGAVYGEAGAQQFLDLWRRHIGLLVDFARASAANDEAGIAAAKAGLETYREDVATFLNTINPNLARDAMVEDQKSYLGGLQSAIGAQAEQDPMAAAKLQTAAEHMPRTAAVLVAGIAKNHPGVFAGRFDGSAATLRSLLLAKLQEHVYLSSIAAGTILAQGESKEPVATVDANSVELANVIGSQYGDEAARQFLAIWRGHVASLLDYARARAVGDNAGAQAAATELSAGSGRFGAFLHAANPRLDQAALTTDLISQVRALLTAIDTQAAGSPSRFANLHAVAGRARAMAERLSTGIASQFPARFS